MFKWLMHKGTAAFERQWNYDAGYIHELIDIDPRAAWMFQRATGIGKYRKDVPLDALAAAGITAVRSEDCGPCTQLAVAMAEREGVDPKVLRAVLTETPLMMPPDVALTWRFTRATLDHDPSADEYRDEIIKRWGPRAVVTLALTILTARMYPTVKYAMGHGKACTRIVVGGAPLASPASARARLSHARLDGRGRGRRAGSVSALARHRSRHRQGAAGVSDDHDDEDLSGCVEVGADET
jgi:hypothetical protein